MDCNEYDYSKLRGRIKEKKMTQEQLACKACMDPSTLSCKLNNAREFSQREMRRICNALEISFDDIPKYFFAQ